MFGKWFGKWFGPAGTPTVAIVGAGMGGISAAVLFRKAGIHSFTIYEKSEHHVTPLGLGLLAHLERRNVVALEDLDGRTVPPVGRARSERNPLPGGGHGPQAIERGMTTIRPATAADRGTLVRALASAFSEDPLFGWMAGGVPGGTLEPKLRIVFDAMLKPDIEQAEHLVFTAEDGTGGAVWKAPNQWKMSTGAMLRVIPAMLRGFGTKAPRMIGALSAIEKVHPKEEHYYLEALGTRQDMQSKGVGSAVIRVMLDRCDTEGMPAYLESSNVRNVPFYARHGFEVTREIVCGKGAPTVTAMWREPR